MALVVVDDERINRVKARMNWADCINSPRSPSTLQELCLRFFIVKRAAVLISKWKKSGENVFDLLPNNLRTDLLNYLLEEAGCIIGMNVREKELKLELMEMLLNHETVKLDLKKFYSMSCDSLIRSLGNLHRVLVHLARNSPKLQHFAMEGQHHHVVHVRYDHEPEAQNRMSPRDGIPHLLKLKDLVHLGIFGLWYWENEDLRLLFSCLKQLVFLKILLHKKVSASGFRNIHLLKNLEEFQFVVGGPIKEYTAGTLVSTAGTLVSNYEWIYSYCAENVRSLKLIGETFEDSLDPFEGHYSAFDLYQISPSIKGTSNLECLHTKSVLPKAEFPNLRYLIFQGPLSMNPKKFLSKSSSFKCLSHLILAAMTYDVIAKMLEFVGKQLVHLYVDNEDTMDFFQILYLCPNLAKFHQNYSVPKSESYKVVQKSNYRALVTKHNVRLVKEFRAVFCKGERVDGLFELILFAPLLEHLVLDNHIISRAECQLVHDVLEDQFMRLGMISFYGLDLDSPCAMADFGLFVQWLVCSAPRLPMFNLFWSNDYLSKKWESEPTVAEFFREFLTVE